MLKRFGLDGVKPMKTPMPTNGQLDLDPNGKDVDQKVYCSMIGSLLYLCASAGYYVKYVYVCKISIRPQRKPSYGRETDPSIFGLYPKLRTLVSQRIFLQVGWIFRFGLGR